MPSKSPKTNYVVMNKIQAEPGHPFKVKGIYNTNGSVGDIHFDKGETIKISDNRILVVLPEALYDLKEAVVKR